MFHHWNAKVLVADVGVDGDQNFGLLVIWNAALIPIYVFCYLLDDLFLRKVQFSLARGKVVQV